MQRWAGRVALVTGASAGIGAIITETLVKHGMNVIGCSRNTDQIQGQKIRLRSHEGSGHLMPIRCDVSKESDVTEMFRRIRMEFGGVDVCVNNAGVCHVAPLTNGSPVLWKDMMEVNMLGVALCGQGAVNSMLERGVDDGHIINISSGSGADIGGGSETNFFTATKFAVSALTEGIRNELKEQKSNIRVSQISPGLVKSELRQRMHNLTYHENDIYYHDKPHVSPQDVAEAVTYILTAPSHLQIHDVKVGPSPTQKLFRKTGPDYFAV